MSPSSVKGNDVLAPFDSVFDCFFCGITEQPHCFVVWVVVLPLEVSANVRLVQTTALGKFVQSDSVCFSMTVDLFSVCRNFSSFAHYSFQFSSCVEVKGNRVIAPGMRGPTCLKGLRRSSGSQHHEQFFRGLCALDVCLDHCIIIIAI